MLRSLGLILNSEKMVKTSLLEAVVAISISNERSEFIQVGAIKIACMVKIMENLNHKNLQLTKTDDKASKMKNILTLNP